MTQGVHIYLVDGPLRWFRVFNSKFWWRIVDFLDRVASGDPSGVVAALEQSTPKLEIWQPGLSGSRLLLVESHAFFLKVGEQIDDPAEHNCIDTGFPPRIR